MARILVVVVVSLVLQQVFAAPLEKKSLVDLLDRLLLAKKDEIPASSPESQESASAEVSDAKLRKADGSPEEEPPDAMEELKKMAEFIHSQKPCGDFHHLPKPAEGKHMDLDVLAVGPDELNIVLNLLKKFTEKSHDKMSHLKALARPDISLEEAANLDKVVQGSFTELAREAQCALGLLFREWLRLESFGAKGFDKSQYRCRHLGTKMLRIANEALRAKKPITELMDEATWAQVGQAALADLRCLADEVAGLNAAIQKYEPFHAQNDPNTVGRDIMKAIVEFQRISQDASILMRTGHALKMIASGQLPEPLKQGEIEKDGRDSQESKENSDLDLGKGKKEGGKSKESKEDSEDIDDLDLGKGKQEGGDSKESKEDGGDMNGLDVGAIKRLLEALQNNS